MIIRPSGSLVGLGFAAPVKTAKKVVEDIKAYGRARKPRMGLVEMVPLSRFGSRLNGRRMTPDVQLAELPQSGLQRT
jgi:S1-C subfamily serine protease